MPHAVAFFGGRTDLSPCCVDESESIKLNNVGPNRRFSLVARKFGFSLVEMMVVIVIMGMLATAVAVGVRRYLDNGRKATVQMELRKFHDAVTQFEAESGQLPTSLEELVNPT